MASIVLGLLAGAVVNGIGAAGAARQIHIDRARAQLLVDDLIAEIATKSYAEPQVAGAAIGLDSGESSATSRLTLDDVDDYHNLVDSPIRRADGQAAAGVTGLARRVRVEWVSTSNPATASATESGVKKATVVVLRNKRILAQAEILRSGVAGAKVTTNVTPNVVAFELEVK